MIVDPADQVPTPGMIAAFARATLRPLSHVPDALTFEPIVANLAGLQLGGGRIQAGAILRCAATSANSWRGAQPVRWIAVVAEGTRCKTARWYQASLGVGDVPPWERDALIYAGEARGWRRIGIEGRLWAPTQHMLHSRSDAVLFYQDRTRRLYQRPCWRVRRPNGRLLAELFESESDALTAALAIWPAPETT